MVCKNNAMLHLTAGICIFLSCSAVKHNKHLEYTNDKTTAMEIEAQHPEAFLDSLLKSYPQYFGELLKNSDLLNVQIVYTQVNRDHNGKARLQHYQFNTDKRQYFYPASTVKLPIALLALQKLNELKGLQIDRNSTLLTETAFIWQTPVYNDPTTPDGKPTVANYIKKILLVSDNDAYNRLYEFLGQDYINREMNKKGYTDVQILHRLDIFLSEEENRNTNPVTLYDQNSRVLYHQPAQRNPAEYAMRKDSIGKGYYRNGKLVEAPMDFSKKNRIGLEDLHKILISLVFPEKVPANERFNITEDDRQFVLKYMSMYPTESAFPPYAADTMNYWPAYCKFLLFGKEKEKLPENIRVFNKVGNAYGHLIDVAYVADFKNKVEFFVSAVIYCNSDGILNDDTYDYDSIGYPFMKNLGRVLYEYELKRDYKIRPNLSPLLFTYD